MKPGPAPGPRCLPADVHLGADTIVGDFVNLYGCRIGGKCRIGSFVEIGRGVIVGQGCRIGSHSYLCNGVTLEDGVVIGSHVAFTNDRTPRATNADGSVQGDADWTLEPTRVGRGAGIGSGSTILCGITIGEKAIVGAGSVVTRDVPAGTVVAGVPARVIRRLTDR